MRLPLFLLALSLGILCNNVLNTVYGPGGMQSQEQLQAHLVTLEENIKELESIGLSIANRVENLSQDESILSVAGHDSGLLALNEIRIRIDGQSEVYEHLMPGSLVGEFKAEVIDTFIIRLISLIFAALVFFTGSILIDAEPVASSKKRRRRENQGIRVHTASLE